MAKIDWGQCVRRLSDKGRRCSRLFSITYYSFIISSLAILKSYGVGTHILISLFSTFFLFHYTGIFLCKTANDYKRIKLVPYLQLFSYNLTLVIKGLMDLACPEIKLCFLAVYVLLQKEFYWCALRLKPTTSC